MTTVSEHPMDDFPVRPLRFDLRGLDDRGVLWSTTCPEFSMFLNAMTVHIPWFERYLIRTMTKAKASIDDAQLLRDITAISGQEAHHAKSFAELNLSLEHRYPKVKGLGQRAREYFSNRAQTDPLSTMVGFTAGYETFTFLAGAIILQNYDRWLAEADPVIKAMWVWHQVEEIEHGAVAFDVYKHLYGEHEWARKQMVLGALFHIGREIFVTYTHMAKVEGWLRNPLKAIYYMGFCVAMLGRFVINALPVFRSSYHPYKHPLVTKRQNPIQIAWRRFEKNGGNVLEIDHSKMVDILKLAPTS